MVQISLLAVGAEPPSPEALETDEHLTGRHALSPKTYSRYDAHCAACESGSIGGGIRAGFDCVTLMRFVSMRLRVCAHIHRVSKVLLLCVGDLPVQVRDGTLDMGKLRSERLWMRSGGPERKGRAASSRSATYFRQGPKGSESPTRAQRSECLLRPCKLV